MNSDIIKHTGIKEYITSTVTWYKLSSLLHCVMETKESLHCCWISAGGLIAGYCRRQICSKYYYHLGRCWSVINVSKCTISLDISGAGQSWNDIFERHKAMKSWTQPPSRVHVNQILILRNYHSTHSCQRMHKMIIKCILIASDEASHIIIFA